MLRRGGDGNGGARTGSSWRRAARQALATRQSRGKWKRPTVQGRFTAPRKPGLVYMLSPHNYVFDPERRQIIHFPGHLMFYAPYATARDVGTGPGAPYIVAPGTPHALLIVVPAGMGEHR